MERELHFQAWLTDSTVESQKERNRYRQEATPPEWILKVERFVKWRLCDPESENTLWLSGTSGFGKSVLAEFIIRTLTEEESLSATAYFFFRKEVQANADSGQVENEILRPILGHQLLLSLVDQLSATSSAYRSYVRKNWEENIALQNLTLTLQELFEILILEGFRAIFQPVAPMYIVLDGVNQCLDPRNSDTMTPLDSVLEVIKLFWTLPTLLPDAQLIRVLITSQPDAKINELLKHSKFVLDKGSNDENIVQYLRSKLDDKLAARFREAECDPYEYFGKRHNGMFLWLVTMVKLLEDAESDEDFDDLLNELPEDSSITVLYSTALKRLSDQLNNKQKIWVKEIFCWCVTTGTNLPLAALEVGMSLTRQLKLGTRRRAKLDDIHKTLSRCGAFVRVSCTGLPENPQEVVNLVHDSFADYLIDSEECQSEFFIDIYDACANMAEASMTYLSEVTVPYYDDDVGNLPLLRAKLDGEYPLFSLANMIWSFHLKEVVNADVNRTQRLTNSLIRLFERKTMQRWIRNVLAYSVQVKWLYQPHTIALIATLQNIGDWLKSNSLVVRVVDSNSIQIQVSDVETQYIEWATEIVSEVFVTGNPKNPGGSILAYCILEWLYEEYRGGFDEDVSTPPLEKYKAILAYAKLDTFKKDPIWYVNLANAHSAGSDVEVLRAAVDLYQKGLNGNTHADWIGQVLGQVASTYAKIYQQEGAPEDLNAAIDNAKTALKASSELSCDSLNLSISLSFFFLLRFEKEGLNQDLDEAIRYASEAVKACPEGGPTYMRATSNYSIALLKRFEQNGSKDDLSLAIRYGVQLVDGGLGENMLEMPLFLSNLCLAFVRRFEQNSDDESLNNAISYGLRSIRLNEIGDPKHVFASCNVGLALFYKNMKTGSHDDLNQAIAYTKSAISTTSETSPIYPTIAINLSLMFVWRKSLEDNDLDESIKYAEFCLSSIARTSPTYPMGAVALAMGLLSRSQIKMSLEDLNRAVRITRDAIKITPATNHAYKTVVSMLALCLCEKFKHERDPPIEELEEAVQYTTAASEMTQESTFNHNQLLSLLSLLLFQKFEICRCPDDLLTAIKYGEKAVLRSSKTLPEYSVFCSNLFVLLLGKFRLVGSFEDLDNAINIVREAAQLIPTEHQYYSTVINNVSLGFFTRYIETTSGSDLDTAIEYARKAVSNKTNISSNHATLVSNLGCYLLRKFQETTRWEYLEESITYGEEVVRLIPQNARSPEQITLYLGLCTTLLERFERRGKKEDIDKSIRFGCDAAQSLRQETGLSYLAIAATLSLAYLRRFESTGERDDLTNSITCAQRAIDVTPREKPGFANVANNLSLAYLGRYESCWSADDLFKAREYGLAAIERQSEMHSSYATGCSNLCFILNNCFTLTSVPSDLNESIEWGEKAVSRTSRTHSLFATFASNLGIAYYERCTQWVISQGNTPQINTPEGEGPDDLRKAIENIRLAVQLTSENDSNYATFSYYLSRALFLRYRLNLVLLDLEDACKHVEIGLAGTRQISAKYWPVALTGALIFLFRFQELGDPKDCEHVINLCESVRPLIPEADPEFPTLQMVTRNIAQLMLENSESREPDPGNEADTEHVEGRREAMLDLNQATIRSLSEPSGQPENESEIGKD